MNALGIPHWKFKFGTLSLTVYRNERLPNTAHYHTLNARFSKLLLFFFFKSIAPVLITANNSQPLCGRQTERFAAIFQGACSTSSETWMDRRVQTTKNSFVLVLNGPVRSDGFSPLLYCLSHDRQ